MTYLNKRLKTDAKRSSEDVGNELRFSPLNMSLRNGFPVKDDVLR